LRHPGRPIEVRFQCRHKGLNFVAHPAVVAHGLFLVARILRELWWVVEADVDDLCCAGNRGQVSVAWPQTVTT
jgi:hypothetical protein